MLDNPANFFLQVNPVKEDIDSSEMDIPQQIVDGDEYAATDPTPNIRAIRADYRKANECEASCGDAEASTGHSFAFSLYGCGLHDAIGDCSPTWIQVRVPCGGDSSQV